MCAVSARSDYIWFFFFFSLGERKTKPSAQLCWNVSQQIIKRQVLPSYYSSEHSVVFKSGIVMIMHILIS